MEKTVNTTELAKGHLTKYKGMYANIGISMCICVDLREYAKKNSVVSSYF